MYMEYSTKLQTYYIMIYIQIPSVFKMISPHTREKYLEIKYKLIFKSIFQYTIKVNFAAVLLSFV